MVSALLDVGSVFIMIMVVVATVLVIRMYLPSRAKHK
jgi:hypothetical protein